MRFVPPTIDHMRTILAGLPDEMTVEVARGISITAKTVAELRSSKTWPGGLVMTVPQERHPESFVWISRPE